MDAFAWEVIGSVAGVVGAVAAITFGVVTFLQGRRHKKESPPASGGYGSISAATAGDIVSLEKESVAPPSPNTDAEAREAVGTEVLTLRPVGQWDPFDLDVHRAIRVGASEDLPALPPYVRRQHDDELDLVLSGAKGSLIFVVTGRSSTGKTRSAYEALARHPLSRNWPLYYPRTSAELIELLRDTRMLRPSVLWLNETQEYLRAPGGEEVATMLRRVLEDTQHAPLVVAGTMWPRYWDELLGLPSVSGSETTQQGQVRQLLLNAVRRVRISPFTEDQAAALTSGSGTDPRMREAVKTARDNDIIEVLAGGPALLERYGQPDSDSARFGAAIVGAAAAARWLGYENPLSTELLTSGAKGYLDPAACDYVPGDWTVRGMTDATAAVLGISALAPHYPPGETTPIGYLLHDYLSQHLALGQDTRPPPSSLWAALDRYADVADRGRLAKAADNRGLYRYAARLAIPAAESGDTVAMRLLAIVYERAGKISEAQQWVRTAADAGDFDAIRELIELWKRTDRVAEAENWLRQFAENANGDAAIEAVDMLGEFDQDARCQWLREHADHGEIGAIWKLVEILGPEDCRDWLTRAAADGDTWAMRELSELLSGDESEQWLRKAAEAGDISAMQSLADILRDSRREDEAILWLHRAAETGDEAAIWSLGALYAERGEGSEATTWLQRLNAEEPDDIEQISTLLERTGGTAAAEEWLRSKARDDLIPGLVLAEWLDDHGRTAEARQYLLTEVEAGDPFAWMGLVNLLNRNGQFSDLEQILRRLAEKGDMFMMRELAAALEDAGRSDEARRWWRRSAQAGNIRAMQTLAAKLEADGELTEAEVWLRRATEAGIRNNISSLARFLQRNARAGEGEVLLRFGIEPGGATAAEW